MNFKIIQNIATRFSPSSSQKRSSSNQSEQNKPKGSKVLDHIHNNLEKIRHYLSKIHILEKLYKLSFKALLHCMEIH